METPFNYEYDAPIAANTAYSKAGFANDPNAIVLGNLTQRYASVNVLEDLNLVLPAGHIVGLMGPNGCGKSTLLKILAGLIEDYTGTVSIFGRAPGEETKAFTSFLPDKTYFPGWMTPKNCIEYFNDFYTDFDEIKALEMIKDFSLDPNQRLNTMSKGMQEKAQLALVMSRRAKLFLLDEPLGGVDPASRQAILDLIHRNYLQNSTLIISTHLVQDIERIFDYAVLMGYRELILAGESAEIYARYGKSMDQIFREVFACLVSF